MGDTEEHEGEGVVTEAVEDGDVLESFGRRVFTLAGGLVYDGYVSPYLDTEECTGANAVEVMKEGLVAHGEGALKYLSQVVYSGHWVYGRRHGEGAGWCGQGLHYVGKWIGGLREGVGMLTVKEEPVFYGTFVADLPHEGKGMYVDLNDDLYEGEFAGGIFRGQLLLSGSQDVDEDNETSFTEIIDKRLHSLGTWSQRFLFLEARRVLFKNHNPAHAVDLLAAADSFEAWYLVGKIYHTEFSNHRRTRGAYGEVELELLLRCAGQAYSYAEASVDTLEVAADNNTVLHKTLDARRALLEVGRAPLVAGVDELVEFTMGVGFQEDAAVCCHPPLRNLIVAGDDHPDDTTDRLPALPGESDDDLCNWVADEEGDIEVLFSIFLAP